MNELDAMELRLRARVERLQGKKMGNEERKQNQLSVVLGMASDEHMGLPYDIEKEEIISTQRYLENPSATSDMVER